MRGQSLFAARFLFLEQAKRFIKGGGVGSAASILRCGRIRRERLVHSPLTCRNRRQAHHEQCPATTRADKWHWFVRIIRARLLPGVHSAYHACTGH